MQTAAQTPATGTPWSAPRASVARTAAGAARLEPIVERVEAGERISAGEALVLHDAADLGTLGYLATLVRDRKHPLRGGARRVTYIVDRNINPTNACVVDCGFCAFYRRPDHPEAYVLSRAEILAKVAETAALGGRQILIQGGHHPAIKTDWWCELIADVRARFPDVNPHALSAPELDHLAKLEKRPVEEVIADLTAAGLGSVPGAGAELLVERVRRIIAPKKMKTDRWLEVHRKLHGAGLRSSATMLYGHVETGPERIEHLARLRDLQDETRGFTAFITWNMQPDGVPDAHLYPPRTTHALYLRVLAVARVFLDNFDNLQTSYVTQGMKVSQISLGYGANDFGGTMLEENVVSAAGCFHLASIERIERMIAAAGCTPRRRNSWYGIVDERHDDAREGPRGPQSRADARVAGAQAP
jgi:cyclic dehypoxanthinyl futalosine synthase